MLFNSIEFLIFLFLTWAVFMIAPAKIRHHWILFTSLFFYATWGLSSFFLMLAVVGFSFFALFVISTSQQDQIRRRLGFATVVLLILILSFAKFNTGLSWWVNDLALRLGAREPWPLLFFALPVGMSFYVLQVSSCLIDVTKREFEWRPSFDKFLCFVTFFPQLIAGPIEKASDLAPQLDNLKTPTGPQVLEGLRLFAVGMCKKVIASPPMAAFADSMMTDPQSQTATHLWLGAICYSSKIYFDFSGYSDMARGMGLLFGVNIAINFDRPLLATTPRELWQRWHISLTNWVRSYVFLPLMKRSRSWQDSVWIVLLSLSLVGIWHGPSVNYLVFGFLHGVVLVLNYQLEKRFGTAKSWMGKFLCWGVTYSIWIQLSIFFQGKEIDRPVSYLTALWLNDWALSKSVLSLGFGVLLMHLIFDGLYARSSRSFNWKDVIKDSLLIAAFTHAVTTLWSQKSESFHYFQF